MTPEQQKKADEFLEAWDTDWGFYAEHVVLERGVTRQEALMFILSLQVSAMRDAYLKGAHPTPRTDCAHCVEEKRVRDIQLRYMEAATRHIEQHEAGDEWKPF